MDALQYIKKYGYILAEVPAHAKEAFAARYYDITGHPAEDHFGGACRIENNPDWWGVSLRLFLPMSDILGRLDIPSKGINIRDDMVRISNNEFIWGLLVSGLRLGWNNGQTQALAWR